tara:strand:+ start:77 stop:397 length:321 start_codon:yes stop_codon:yes gene_type:complete
MKNRLNKITIAFLALGFLVLLFPMRTGIIKDKGKTAVANLGPHFILSNPSRASIYNAYYEEDKKKWPDDYRYKSSLKSKVDYGRTFILLLLTSAGGLGTFLWSRKI